MANRFEWAQFLNHYLTILDIKITFASVSNLKEARWREAMACIVFNILRINCKSHAICWSVKFPHCRYLVHYIIPIYYITLFPFLV